MISKFRNFGHIFSFVAIFILSFDNSYAGYVNNDPINSKDPSGLCGTSAGDSQSMADQCTVSFSQETVASERIQNSHAIQDRFASGSGQNFVVDPQRAGINTSMDIGTQIEASIQNGGRFAAAFQESAANGGAPVSFGTQIMRHDAYQGQGGAKLIGRYSSEITGSISASADGSFTFEAVGSFDFGDYNWALDSTAGGLRGIAENAAVLAGGLTPNPIATIPAGPPGNSFPTPWRVNAMGRTIQLPPSRTFSVSGFGSGR